MVEIAWAIFRILADYRLRHLVNSELMPWNFRIQYSYLLIHMKFCKTGQKRRPLNTGDCLIEVTAWTWLTVFDFQKIKWQRELYRKPRFKKTSVYYVERHARNVYCCHLIDCWQKCELHNILNCKKRNH